MRPRSEDPVRADQLERVCRNGTYRFVRGVVQHHGHVERRLAHQIEGGRDGIAAAQAADLLERQPHRALVRGGGVRDLDALRSERAEEVLPARQSLRDVAGDPAPVFAPAERAQRALGPALLRPGGKHAREQGAAGAVGVLVEGEVDLRGSRLEQLEQRLDQGLVRE